MHTMKIPVKREAEFILTKLPLLPSFGVEKNLTKHFDSALYIFFSQNGSLIKSLMMVLFSQDRTINNQVKGSLDFSCDGQIEHQHLQAALNAY